MFLFIFISSSCLDEVIRTRIYVKDIGDWEKIGAAYAN